MDIYIDKLYSSDRKDEPCSIGIPIKKGEIQNLDNVAVIQNNKSIPLQKKVTSRYDDGSVRFMFLRFLADLDANKKTVLKCIPNLTQDEKYPQKECDNIMTNESLIIDNDGITVDNGKLSFFCYKELPSLNRLGNNTLLLESLAIAYELTKDEKYLKLVNRHLKKLFRIMLKNNL